ncbi:carbohydrate-binding protein [Streptomyces armeniacus]|uniref:carbohydrate-binding protein n=1 Tax=Streptomyces armeniacus TaxID=83291 RepID=UPI0026D01F4A
MEGETGDTSPDTRADGTGTPGTAGGPDGVSRKTVLKAAMAVGPAAVLLGSAPALARNRTATPDKPLTPTPYCDDGDDPTPPQTEGPYFTPGSPERDSLVEPGSSGTLLTVSGFVFGLQCQPLGDVLLDWWQADSRGAYDNVGYRYRGHQFTDSTGAFKLTTHVPGLYPGRTRHLHVKLQAPNRPVLTTQLYFPGEPRNNTDPIFNPALLMDIRDGGGGKEGSFDFVLNVQGSGPSDPPGGTWKAATGYRPGDRVTFGGATYECLQAHQATAGWEPPHVPALWRRV